MAFEERMARDMAAAVILDAGKTLVFDHANSKEEDGLATAADEELVVF